MSEEPGKSRWENLKAAWAPPLRQDRHRHAPPPRPLGAARVPREPAASARGRRGARTGDRGATPGIPISGRWLAVDFNECGLHVDVALRVTASCGPREGQRAALGSRRPGRTDGRRKDRRTSRSWVSGAPAAGALGPLPRHPHAPRRLLRLPGASPGSRPPAPGLGCHGRVPARARPLSRADPVPWPLGLPRRPPACLPPGAGGGGALGAPSPRTCRGSEAPGSPGAARLSRELGPVWAEVAREQESPRPLWPALDWRGRGGRSLPGQSPWWPPAIPWDQGAGEWTREPRGFQSLGEPVPGAE